MHFIVAASLLISLSVRGETSTFEFVDVRRQQWKFAEILVKKPLTVVVIRDSLCPISRKLAPEIARIEKNFADKASFIFVNVSKQDNLDAMWAEIKTFGFQGLYVPDPEGEIARRLNARTTTEVFVFDNAFTLQYRGAVHDQFSLTSTLPRPKQRYLENALKNLLANKTPEVARTVAPGCLLDFSSRGRESSGTLAYYETIHKIVEKNCIQCHNRKIKDSIPLENYTDVKNRAKMIEFVVRHNIMPPWAAVDHTEKWKNSITLSQQERDLFLRWLASDKPMGTEPPRSALASKGPTEWKLGKPDVILFPEEEISIPAEGGTVSRYLYVDPGFTEDKWISSAEISVSVPPEMIHHLSIDIIEEASPGRMKLARGTPGWTYGRDRRRILRSDLISLLPGNQQASYGQDVGLLIPAGASLEFSVHYAPNGRATVDRPRLALRFHEKAPTTQLFSYHLQNVEFKIPPRASNHLVRAELRVNEPMKLVGVTPHMHFRGRAAEIELERPNGKRETLFKLSKYNFKWQLSYYFKDPPVVPAGSRLIARAWYDNSAGNAANPDPNSIVRSGDDPLKNEMMIFGIFWSK